MKKWTNVEVGQVGGYFENGKPVNVAFWLVSGQDPDSGEVYEKSFPAHKYACAFARKVAFPEAHISGI